MTIHADNPAREPAAAPGATADSETTERTTETEAEETEGADPEEAEGEPSLDETADGESDADGEADEDDGPGNDTVEIEEGGKKYKIPKALEGGFLRQADYTRKTQDIAETKRKLATETTQFNERREAATKTIVERGELAAVGKELAEYEKVDWAKLLASANPEDQRLYHQLQHQQKELIGKRNEIAQSIQKAEDEYIGAQRADFAKRRDETRTQNEKNIKGWSVAEDARMVQDAGKFYGWTVEQLLPIAADHAMYRTVWDAVQYRRLLEKKPAKPSTKPADTVQPKPVAKVAAKGASAKPGLHDNLSTAEWIKRRQKQAAGA